MKSPEIYEIHAFTEYHGGLWSTSIYNIRIQLADNRDFVRVDLYNAFSTECMIGMLSYRWKNDYYDITSNHIRQDPIEC